MNDTKKSLPLTILVDGDRTFIDIDELTVWFDDDRRNGPHPAIRALGDYATHTLKGMKHRALTNPSKRADSLEELKSPRSDVH